jgi:hypothetical protein
MTKQSEWHVFVEHFFAVCQLLEKGLKFLFTWFFFKRNFGREDEMLNHFAPASDSESEVIFENLSKKYTHHTPLFDFAISLNSHCVLTIITNAD